MSLTPEELAKVKALLALLSPGAGPVAIRRSFKVPGPVPFSSEEISFEASASVSSEKEREMVYDRLQAELETRIGSWKADRLLKTDAKNGGAPKPPAERTPSQTPIPVPAAPRFTLADYLDPSMGWLPIRDGPGLWIYGDGRNLLGQATAILRDLEVRITQGGGKFTIEGKMFKQSRSDRDGTAFINCWPAS